MDKELEDLTEKDFNLVQQIVVFGEGSHEDVIHACLFACLASYERYHKYAAYKQWLSGAFTKTVREAKTAGIMAKVASIEDGVDGYCNNVHAIAFIPAKLDRESYIAKKTQVSGLERPRDGWMDGSRSTHRKIIINPDAKMTTGKTAAQVCHAGIAARRTMKRFFIDEWNIEENQHEFDLYLRVWKDPEDLIRIRDAGLTEITPGTLTVIAGVIHPDKD